MRLLHGGENPLRGFVGLEGTDAGGFRQLPCRVQFELDELEKLWSLKCPFDKWRWVLLSESQINYLALIFYSGQATDYLVPDGWFQRICGVFYNRFATTGTGTDLESGPLPGKIAYALGLQVRAQMDL